MIDSNRIPHLMKYMGSKREILEFIISSIQELNIESEWFCDLFSGTSIVGAALRDEFNILSNDIQSYSEVFAKTYFSNLNRIVDPEELIVIKRNAIILVEEFHTKYPNLNFDYEKVSDFSTLQNLENQQQSLFCRTFDIGFHLFVKYYSGTYWSYEQCVWIDSIRAVADEYIDRPEYRNLILSSLIFAMSYTSQSTGHFAQYRDVTESNMEDILIYRTRDIWTLFEKKFLELISELNYETPNQYKITTLDYLDCLRIIEENTIVYADPPYSFVHYSRFYHAIETLVCYDYPKIKYKGRYRENRHQSPFCKKTEVKEAFTKMFECINSRSSHLILSYSNNGMITLEEIIELGKRVFNDNYECQVRSKDYLHSKMGRSDKNRMNVEELVITYKRMDHE
jgi:adenine-specific DNA-methyltransferase